MANYRFLLPSKFSAGNFVRALTPLMYTPFQESPFFNSLLDIGVLSTSPSGNYSLVDSSGRNLTPKTGPKRKTLYFTSELDAISAINRMNYLQRRRWYGVAPLVPQQEGEFQFPERFTSKTWRVMMYKIYRDRSGRRRELVDRLIEHNVLTPKKEGGLYVYIITGNSKSIRHVNPHEVVGEEKNVKQLRELFFTHSKYATSFVNAFKHLGKKLKIAEN
jgi:hypothetical protein